MRVFMRDVNKGVSPLTIARRVSRYSMELASAQLWLRDVQELGRGVRCFHRPHIENSGTMRIGHNTLLRSVLVPVELACGPGATLEIGADCSINYGVSIGCTKYIRIGDRCRIGPYTMIIDTPFHDAYDRMKRPAGTDTIIEHDVWLGAKVNVMPGVTIGHGSIIGTGSVVTKDVPAFSVAAGVPAKVIDHLDPNKFVMPPSSSPERDDDR
jgi:acetyltransferase-like isoleucine patch superfamily enzyme